MEQTRFERSENRVCVTSLSKGTFGQIWPKTVRASRRRDEVRAKREPSLLLPCPPHYAVFGQELYEYLTNQICNTPKEGLPNAVFGQELYENLTNQICNTPKEGLFTLFLAKSCTNQICNTPQEGLFMLFLAKSCTNQICNTFKEGLFTLFLAKRCTNQICNTSKE